MATTAKRSQDELLVALKDHETNTAMFTDAVEALYKDVTTWSLAKGWSLSGDSKVIKPYWDKTGLLVELYAYHAPFLNITTPEGEIKFKPVGYNIAGAKGRVDMYSYPNSYEVILLLQTEGNWIVRTRSGIDWPHAWNKDTFVELAIALLKTE
jgi:hypothetical protein